MDGCYGGLSEASIHENISYVHLKGYHELCRKLELLRVVCEFDTGGETNQGGFYEEVVHILKLLPVGD